MRKNLLCGFGCVALAALAFVLVCGGLALLQVKQTAKALPKLTQDTIHTEFEATRNLVSAKFDAVDKRVEFLAKTTDARIGSLQADTFKELGSIRNDTFAQLTAVRTEGLQALNAQLTETNKHVGTLVGAYADIPKVVGARLDPFTDCSKNKLCLQGQAADTLFAMRTTSRDVSTMTYTVNGAMPVFTDNFKAMTADFRTSTNAFAVGFPKIITNFDGITYNIKKFTTTHWYDKLIGYTLNGAMLYRQLNPATNLTVKAAEIITSQK